MTKRILKFLITGAIGVSVNLGTLHLLVVIGLQYLLASVFALTLSTLVGFLLQKFWTFESASLTRAHRQFMLYTGVALFNLAVNTLLVFVLVEYFHTHYLLAQFIGAGVVALTSFAAYNLYIFKPSL